MPPFEHFRPNKQELTENEMLELSNGGAESLGFDLKHACKPSVNYCSYYQLIFSTSKPLTIICARASIFNQYTFQSSPRIPPNQSHPSVPNLSTHPQFV
jgi:hypothetical protein